MGGRHTSVYSLVYGRIISSSLTSIVTNQCSQISCTTYDRIRGSQPLFSEHPRP